MAEADTKPVVTEGEEEVKTEQQAGEAVAEGDAQKPAEEETTQEKAGGAEAEGGEQATDGAGADEADEAKKGEEEKQEEEVKTEEAQEEGEAKAEAEGEAEQAATEGDAAAEAEAEQAENKEEAQTEEAAQDAAPEEEAEEKQEEEGEQTAEAQEEEEPATGEDQNGVEEEQAEPEEAEGEEKSAAELTDEERERYRQLFQRKAVDGRLDLKGFKILFRLMGEVLSSEESEQMFEDGDKDDSNTIDFDEFCRLYSKFSQAEQIRKEAMLQSIDKLFPSNDGEPVELRKVEGLLLKLQKPDLDMRLVREKSDLGENDIRSLVRAMDKDGNGKISKQEFVDTLCQHLDV